MLHLLTPPSSLTPGSHWSFTVSIVLPFPECHIVGIIQYVAFSEWLLSVSSVYLSFTHAFSRRRQWHPTPVLLPGKSHGWRRLEAAVHGVMKSRTRLSNFTFTFRFHPLEQEMATHSSVLAWRIPGMGQPGGLPSMGSHRVGHDWSNLAAAAACLFMAK